MDDLFLNPIQDEEVGVWVYTSPKHYYPDYPSSHLVSFSGETTVTVLYGGVLTYLPIGRTTKDEVHNCRILHLRSRDHWVPFLMNGQIYCMESLTGQIDEIVGG